MEPLISGKSRLMMKYHSLGRVCKLSIDLNSAEFRCRMCFFPPVPFGRCRFVDSGVIYPKGSLQFTLVGSFTFLFQRWEIQPTKIMVVHNPKDSHKSTNICELQQQ